MKRYVTGLALVVLSMSAQASVPPDLQFSGKPIDALCFSNLEDNSDKVNLNQCGIKKDAMKIKGHNSDLLKQGFIGFDWQATNTSYPSQGSSYYKWFEAGHQAFWVYTLNNGGGSGDFTAINQVKRLSPNKLQVKTIASGDRCNGGIQDVSVNDTRLSFSVNLTAADFLSLAGDNPHNLQAYDDLSACAVCCTAKAFYEVGSSLDPRLSWIDFSGHGTNLEEMPQQGKYQACFNKLFARYVSKGTVKLNTAQLKQFVKDFNTGCVK
ncbi:hypothetical protein [Legionella sp. CNM-4043-24]|uniref:hypothetical protein n=1 Tax=Legionella sp. CNM-4043-24 TaxID=3421646 RepID=UPI00403AE314